ncbi:hypothetical protein MHU86_10298 [Fragilaria crotonensis]|nr:hypothetical protein MHU86_10298 [Fragilaria crotonensis]
MPPRQVFRARCALAPSAWQKELQRTIAVSCLDEISQGPLLKVDILKKKMAKLYHGDRNVVDSLGYADHLLAGRHQFEYLWEKEEISSNGTDRNSNQPSAYDLVLSTVCSRDESVRYLVGKQFTAQSIKGATQKGHAVISGTTLLGQAQLVLRNWKKALAYGAEFLLPDGSLRSGTDTADYYNHVLKEMYRHLNITTTITAILDDNGDDDDDDQPPIAVNGLPIAIAGDNEMPESYFSRVLFHLSCSGLSHTMKSTNQSYFRQRTVHTKLVRRHPLVEPLQKKGK